MSSTALLKAPRVLHLIIDFLSLYLFLSCFLPKVYDPYGKHFSNKMENPRFLILAISLCIFPISASAWSLSKWVHNSGYDGKGTPAEKIRCYALPYGGIGFLGDLLTYYTIICLNFGKSPIWPFRELNKPFHSIILASVSLVATVLIHILTNIRCRQSWEFLFISLWKLSLSISLAAITIHVMVVVHGMANAGLLGISNLRDRIDESSVLRWLLLYGFGILLGLIGISSLVRAEISSNDWLRSVTIGFGALTGVFFGTGVSPFLEAQWWRRDMEEGYGSWIFSRVMTAIIMVAASGLLAVGFFLAPYSDFALATIAGPWTGVPSSDDAILFWAYFIAQRLPMLSF